jgi:hypothetical protein
VPLAQGFNVAEADHGILVETPALVLIPFDGRNNAFSTVEKNLSPRGTGHADHNLDRMGFVGVWAYHVHISLPLV